MSPWLGLVHGSKSPLGTVQGRLDVFRGMGIGHEASLIGRRRQINALIEHQREEATKCVGITGRGLREVVDLRLGGEEEPKHATGPLSDHIDTSGIGPRLKTIA